MCLIVIGSHAATAVAKCPDDIEQHSQIEWQAIKGMRNRIAHDYSNLDLVIVWETVKQDLPTLIEQIDGVLKDNG